MSTLTPDPSPSFGRGELEHPSPLDERRAGDEGKPRKGFRVVGFRTLKSPVSARKVLWVWKSNIKMGLEMRADVRFFWLPILRAVNAVSRLALLVVDYVGEVAMTFAAALRYVFTGSFSAKDVFDQMAIIGVNSLPIVLLTVMFSGMVLAAYTAAELVQLNLGGVVGGMVAVTMAREAAPVLSAIVVAARAGSAMAAELGSMKITEQIDALRALAVSPEQYLVVPRFLASVAMLPVVTMLANVVGTAGGYLVASVQGVSGRLFLSSISRYLTGYDINTGLLKTLVFGAIIALVSCHQGLKATGGAAGVGRATTNAVVLSVVFVYMADFLLVQFLFGAGDSLK
jgi:phospholipid/cholesterol/gamma-HCH transport system permease protein